MTLIGSGFKAALIGCGGMGRGHAAKAKSLGIELVGYCDEIEEKAAAALTDFGGSYVTTDADRIMRDDSIDLIVIATHHVRTIRSHSLRLKLANTFYWRNRCA